MAEAKSVITTQVKIVKLTQGTQIDSHGCSLFFDCIGDSVGSTGDEIFGK